jgi:hypothetical protein
MKNLSKLFSLTFKTFVLLSLAFCLGAFVANAAGMPEIAPTAGCVTMAFCLIPNQLQIGTLASITATDIVTEWGALIRSNVATAQDLMVRLRQVSETEAIFKRRITDYTVLERANAQFTPVLQSFQKAFTPIGGVTFKPNKIPLQRLKIDAAEYPDTLVESWLTFLTDTNVDRKQWPFAKWYADQLILQSNEDFEKYEVFGGVPGTVTPGTATVPGTNILGIRKQLNDANAAGKTLTLTMGAVPTDPLLFVKYVEDMFKLAASTNEVLFQNIDQINMSKTLMRRFMDGMRLKYTMYYNQTDIVTLINTDIKIVGLNSHAGSNKIWATPAFNRECGIRGPQNESVMLVENVDRQVKWYTDFHKGVGFWIPEYIYQNDVDLV